MARSLGGDVQRSDKHEHGPAELLIDDSSSIFFWIITSNIDLDGLGDSVSTLPDGFVATGHTTNCQFAAIANVDKKMFGLQFILKLRIPKMAFVCYKTSCSQFVAFPLIIGHLLVF